MNYSVNPFQELYVADTPSLDHFVRLFSAVPLDAVSMIHPLFQVSNVVLVGTQGCGKTMLLSLLRPEIREAYYNSGIEFPVRGESAKFLSAGVNFTKSAFLQFAEITVGQGDEQDLRHLPYYFADFFNYWIVRDLLQNMARVAEKPEVFGKMVSPRFAVDFVRSLAEQECWFEVLKSCHTLRELESRINDRITLYRQWLGMNLQGKGIPPKLQATKTAIGEPIVRTVEVMKKTGLLEEDVPVFVRVDQIEELHQDPGGPKGQLRLAFRQMLNGAFGRRDHRVVYRWGSRRYGWNQPEQLVIHGTGGRLEERRDYLLIDLDEAFRGKEHQRATFFQQFAEDAFRKRISHLLQGDIPTRKNLLRSVFGSSPAHANRAGYFLRERGETVPMERVLAIEGKDEVARWSPSWIKLLRNIYQKDPLQAVLAAAWGRQKGNTSPRVEHRTSPPPKRPPYPWDGKWWRKERLLMAVLQIAARRSQRLMWWGARDILALSGTNISAFLHICHEIWDQFLQQQRALPDSQRINPFTGQPIGWKIQAIGVQNASAVWYRKLSERPGGETCRRLVDKLGNFLRRNLRDDRAMSNPGRNGISLKVAELESDNLVSRELWLTLRDAVGYGDLVEVKHTTKEKAGEARRKYYLNPILAPVFQLPEVHLKEPRYWKIADLLALAREAELPFIYRPEFKAWQKANKTERKMGRTQASQETH